jgi:alpha-mannosidase
MSGQDAPNVRVTLATPLTDAREMNGQEQPVGPATVNDGELVTSFTAYQPRTIAVKLAPPASKLPEPVSQPVELTYDASVATLDGKPAEGCFDCNPNIQDAPQGKALPAEMLPSDIAYAGVHFHLAPGGSPNAVTTWGQTIPLPEGKFNRLYILAASYGGDQTDTFGVGSRSTVSHVSLPIEDWTGFIGQWDTRTWNERRVQLPVPPEPAANDKSPQAERARRIRSEVKEHGPTIETHLDYTGLKPGYIKRAPVAWFASHRHSEAAANEPYSYSYLFAYTIDLPAGSNSLMLPNNPRIRILAASVSDESSSATPVQPLYDILDRANVDMSRWQVAKGGVAP